MKQTRWKQWEMKQNNEEEPVRKQLTLVPLFVLLSLETVLFNTIALLENLRIPKSITPRSCNLAQVVFGQNFIGCIHKTRRDIIWFKSQMLAKFTENNLQFTHTTYWYSGIPPADSNFKDQLLKTYFFSEQYMGGGLVNSVLIEEKSLRRESIIWCGISEIYRKASILFDFPSIAPVMMTKNSRLDLWIFADLGI